MPSQAVVITARRLETRDALDFRAAYIYLLFKIQKSIANTKNTYRGYLRTEVNTKLRSTV